MSLHHQKLNLHPHIIATATAVDTSQRLLNIPPSPSSCGNRPGDCYTKTPGICGGRPVVRGTRIHVKVLVNYYRMQESIDDILACFPQLTHAQFDDALSYYYDNKKEIDADIEADELPKLF